MSATAETADTLPDELELPLRKPVEHAGMTYTHLKLKEPTAAQWAEWDGKKGVDADITAISVVGGIPSQAVAKIGARDIIIASRFIARFLD